MIPRIEQKLEIDKSHYLDLLKWIKYKGGIILYPERLICSRYFDTKNMAMFYDTLEGIVPRKKIRIRTYGVESFISSKSSYSLEIKMTTEHKRMKKINSNINIKSLMHDGYYDNLYGLCNPIIDISYLREYFLINDIRITIDKLIKYQSINSYKSIKKKSAIDQSYVLEIKADINTNTSFLLNNFDFPRSKFSKYERAIEFLIN